VLDTSHNSISNNYQGFGFKNPSINNYSLSSAAILAIDKGTDAGKSNTGFPLTPASMYQSVTSTLLPRMIVNGLIDLGAYEYAGTTVITADDLPMKISIFPNPSHGAFEIILDRRMGAGDKTVLLYDMLGRNVYRACDRVESGSLQLDFSSFQKGLYLLKILSETSADLRLIGIQ